ncbi:MAG TPA: lysine--tRNA ligase [Acidimicrobiales bacterium]|nr:lysine--tRNA ligase [Acidimicrobiales bacterium]
MTAAHSTDEIPYVYPDTTAIGDLTSKYGDKLEAGEETGETVTVAGRLMLLRVQGKLAFGTLRDWSGSIQLFALDALTADFEAFKHLNLGDWIGATGDIVRTKRGELSVKLSSWDVLARARHGFGDKWRGVNDPDLRFRQREVDLWANDGVRERFLMRSKVVATIRQLMAARGFVEAETPVLLPQAGGANAKPFVTHFNAMHADFYLRIATELYLKRLVVGGFERVFEIGRIFRNEGVGPKYNPEFTMLEAYQAYADYHDVAELVEYIVSGAAEVATGSTLLTFQGRQLDLTPPWRKATMTEVIAEVTGHDISLDTPLEELRRIADELEIQLETAIEAGEVLAEIYDKAVEPNLWGPVHVMDYPQAVSPLTRKHRSKPGYVERLTPIVAGREIGECYSELVDPDDQRARFEAQVAARERGYDEAMAMDEDFIRALERGMPPLGGIGLGIDRLIMLLADVSHIREVILFPALRPGAGREPEEDESPA